MSKNLTTTPRPVDHVAAALTATDAPAVEFAHLDPRALTIELNIRTTTDLEPSFVGSVRQYGVLMPVLVVRTADGQLMVRAGQRRTLAAIEAGISTIPARIIDAGPAGDRFVQQLIENDQRASITDAERTDAIEQMHLDLGLNAAQIAGRLSMPKAQVRAALRVARSTTTRDRVQIAGLTIDQAAQIAAFDDDPETVDKLTAVAVNDPDQLAHAIQRVRDERAEARAITNLTEDYRAAGITVLDEHPGWNHPTTRELRNLRDSEDQVLNADDHTACPGHAVTIDTSYWSSDLTVTPWCVDYAEHGHQRPSWDRAAAAATTGKMTDEQKAERAAVVDGNKQWRAARTVRREWLATLAARRSAPKGTTQAIGWAVASHTAELDRAARDGHKLARTLLGLPVDTYGGRDQLAQAIEAAAPGRANVITLVIALSAIEDATDDMAWRRPISANSTTAKYLRTLEAWGYVLSPIERTTAAYDHDAQAGAASDTEPTPDANAGEQEAPADETGADGGAQREDYTIAIPGADGTPVIVATVNHIDLPYGDQDDAADSTEPNDHDGE